MSFGYFGDIIDRWGGNFGRLARERYDKPNYPVWPDLC
jgi:hypothetical protein